MISQPRSLFKTRKRSGHGRGASVAVRIPDPLLQRLAVFGNGEGLTLSDTVRAVVEIGLDHVDCKR